MIYFCTKCSINWAALLKCQGEGDEDYEVCPQCNTDTYLEDGNDIDAFIKCPFTGKIYNTHTGLERKTEPTIQEFSEPVQHRAGVKITQEQKDEAVDRALDAYHQHGEAAYYQTLKQQYDGIRKVKG